MRSNLESQVEDQTIVLGRELRSGEVSDILKRHGHRERTGYDLIYLGK